MSDLKYVNIYPNGPIYLNPPIRCVTRKVHKSIDDIRTCLMCRARVEEILPNGSIINLDISNYDKNNYIVKEEPIIITEELSIDVIEEESTEVDEVIEEPTTNNNEEEDLYNKVYNETIGGVDLTKLSRKQRRALEAKARNTAYNATKAVTNKDDSIEEVVSTVDIEM